MASREEILQAIEKHGSKAAAARALRIPASTLKSALGRGGGSKPAPEPRAVGKSLSEFRNTYDKATIIPKRIDAALETLGDGWDFEVSFAKLAGVSLADLGRFRDRYADHVVQLNRDSRRAWAGKASVARKMREML